MCIGAVVVWPGGGGGGIGCVVFDAERTGGADGVVGIPPDAGGGGGGAERIDWLGGAPDLNDDDAPFVWPSAPNAPESVAVPTPVSVPVPTAWGGAEPAAGVGAGGTGACDARGGGGGDERI
jgi:hypothetical protein